MVVWEREGERPGGRPEREQAARGRAGAVAGHGSGVEAQAGLGCQAGLAGLQALRGALLRGCGPGLATCRHTLGVEELGTPPRVRKGCPLGATQASLLRWPWNKITLGHPPLLPRPSGGRRVPFRGGAGLPGRGAHRGAHTQAQIGDQAGIPEIPDSLGGLPEPRLEEPAQRHQQRAPSAHGRWVGVSLRG